MIKLDSADQRFFLRQLEEIEAEMILVVRPELKARALIPTTFIDPGADLVTYRELDKVGSAKVISTNAKDLPRVDVSGKEYTKSVRMLGDSYGYTVKEIQRANKAGGIALDRERAQTAREVLLRLEDQISALGDTTTGLGGALNSSAVTASNAPNGAAVSPLWANKTPAEILADLNSLVANVRSTTNGIFAPDTILVPETSYTILAQTPFSTTGFSNATILSFFLSTNPWIKSIEPWFYLETAGSGSTRRLAAMKKDPRVLKQHLVDFTQMEPQLQGLETVVNCVSQHAGVTIYQPAAMRYLDGV